MAETPKYMVQNELGCGLMGAIFQRGGVKARKTATPPPLPPIKKDNSINYSGSYKSKRRRGGSGEMALIDASKSARLPPSKPVKKPSPKPTLPTPRPPNPHHQIQPKRPSNSLRSSNSSLDEVSQVTNLSYARRLRREPTFTESELSMRVAVRQKSSENGVLYRASSGNAMLFGHLGSLKQSSTNVKTLDYHLTTVQKRENSSVVMGNIVRKPSSCGGGGNQLGNIYRGGYGSVNRFDPEVLKNMGNEKYKQGKLEEALALYSRAIACDSSKASFYSNRSAALIGLGRLLEAVFDCRVAVRIEPCYQRAHHRLAKLYLRLGEAEKALCHYKHSGPKVDTKDIAQAQALKTHVNRCTEARKLKDWETLLKESQSAMSSGADSAPQIYTMQVEALLNLHRHQEAYTIIQKAPNFDINYCTQFFGSAGNANLLTIRAQVYMAAGRFEEAVAAANRAARIDSRDEVNRVAKTARAMALARSNGNQLFKESKFSDACIIYSEGLEHDPYNSVLLCNRAACRSKLGQFEKAVEDCTAALNLRHSYTKARLRRADCNAKLERWEAAIQDYEVLTQETPGDEEVERALYEAQIQLKKQRSEDIKDLKSDSSLVMISSKEHFRHFVIAPGMSVVLFCNKTCHNRVLLLAEQLCRRFPFVNFLKVEIEDHPYIVKLEDVNSVPAFKIYKNGSTIKEIPGDKCDLLESSVKLISNTAYN